MILQNVDNLSKYSTVIVTRKCDICGEEKNMTFGNYNKRNKKNDICHKCVLKSQKGENSPSWKGGVKNCPICGGKMSRRESKICRNCFEHDKNKCEICGKITANIYAKVCGNCRSLKYRGENSPTWKPELSEKDRINKRMYVEYNDWRKEVYKINGYTCQKCGKIGKHLHAHHIENYSSCKNKRIDVKNGITLCRECHQEFHKIFGYSKNNKEQIEIFINN